MHLLLFLAYIGIGILAGVCGGLLGISGGVITIPLLLFIFERIHLSSEYVMHIAIGTSMAAMVFNALSATWAHHKRKSVLWTIVRSMAPGIILGSILGALTARYLSSSLLEKIFGSFECLLGIYFLFPSKSEFVEGKNHHHLLKRKSFLNSIGMGVGALSNILGIGGGIVTVPLLMTLQVPPKKAIGTSAATGLLISFIGALAYLYFGLKVVHNEEIIGYLDLPAFFIISIATLLSAPYGVKLAHILPNLILRRIFAVALILTGILMLT